MGEQKNLQLLCLGLLITAAAYLDSPFSILNRDYYYQTEALEPAPAFTQPVSRNLPEYEMLLVEERKSNGYIIETYKEFEIIRDKDGKIIKKKPGSRTEEIKYRDYTFRQAE